MSSNISSHSVCSSCGTTLALPEGPVSRGEVCPKCLTSVRICKNCRNYDPKSYNECREPSAERVVEKDKANFCDYFALGSESKTTNSPSKEDTLRELDNLFKK